VEGKGEGKGRRGWKGEGKAGEGTEGERRAETGKGREGEGRMGRERKVEFPHVFNPTVTTGCMCACNSA